MGPRRSSGGPGWFLGALNPPGQYRLFSFCQSFLSSFKLPNFCWSLFYTVICSISEMPQTPGQCNMAYLTILLNSLNHEAVCRRAPNWNYWLSYHVEEEKNLRRFCEYIMMIQTVLSGHIDNKQGHLYLVNTDVKNTDGGLLNIFPPLI